MTDFYLMHSHWRANFTNIFNHLASMPLLDTYLAEESGINTLQKFLEFNELGSKLSATEAMSLLTTLFDRLDIGFDEQCAVAYALEHWSDISDLSRNYLVDVTSPQTPDEQAYANTLTALHCSGLVIEPVAFEFACYCACCMLDNSHYEYLLDKINEKTTAALCYGIMEGINDIHRTKTA